MATKRCSHGFCKNDTRYSRESDHVQFYPFPNPVSSRARCKAWIEACNRPKYQLNISLMRTPHYICSKHFPHPDGPTDSHPDPEPCSDSQLYSSRVNYHHRLTRLRHQQELEAKQAPKPSTEPTPPPTTTPTVKPIATTSTNKVKISTLAKPKTVKPAKPKTVTYVTVAMTNTVNPVTPATTNPVTMTTSNTINPLTTASTNTVNSVTPAMNSTINPITMTAGNALNPFTIAAGNALNPIIIFPAKGTNTVYPVPISNTNTMNPITMMNVNPQPVATSQIINPASVTTSDTVKTTSDTVNNLITDATNTINPPNATNSTILRNLVTENQVNPVAAATIDTVDLVNSNTTNTVNAANPNASNTANPVTVDTVNVNPVNIVNTSNAVNVNPVNTNTANAGNVNVNPGNTINPNTSNAGVNPVNPNTSNAGVNPVNPQIIMNTNYVIVNNLGQNNVNDTNKAMTPGPVNQIMFNPNVMNSNVTPNVMNPNMINFGLLNPNAINANMNQNLLSSNLVNTNILNPNMLNQNNVINTNFMGSNINPNFTLPMVNPVQIPILNSGFVLKNIGGMTVLQPVQATPAPKQYPVTPVVSIAAAKPIATKSDTNTSTSKSTHDGLKMPTLSSEMVKQKLRRMLQNPAEKSSLINSVVEKNKSLILDAIEQKNLSDKNSADKNNLSVGNSDVIKDHLRMPVLMSEFTEANNFEATQMIQNIIKDVISESKDTISETEMPCLVPNVAETKTVPPKTVTTRSETALQNLKDAEMPVLTAELVENNVTKIIKDIKRFKESYQKIENASRYKCTECDFKAEELTVFLTHIQVNHGYTMVEKRFQCRKCDFNTVKYETFVHHTNNHPLTDIRKAMDLVSLSKEPKEPKFKCKKCPFTCNGKKRFRRHRKGHRDQDLIIKCGGVIDDNEEVEGAGEAEVEVGEVGEEDMEVGETFNYLLTDRTFSCPQCPYSGCDSAAFLQHMEHHTTRSPDPAISPDQLLESLSYHEPNKTLIAENDDEFILAVENSCNPKPDSRTARNRMTSVEESIRIMTSVENSIKLASVGSSTYEMTSMESSMNQTPSVESFSNQTSSVGSSTNPAPSLESSINQIASMESSVNQTASMESSMNQMPSVESTMNQTASLESSTNKMTSVGSSTNPMPSVESYTNQTASTESSTYQMTSMENSINEMSSAGTQTAVMEDETVSDSGSGTPVVYTDYADNKSDESDGNSSPESHDDSNDPTYHVGQAVKVGENRTVGVTTGDVSPDESDKPSFIWRNMSQKCPNVGVFTRRSYRKQQAYFKMRQKEERKKNLGIDDASKSEASDVEDSNSDKGSDDVNLSDNKSDKGSDEVNLSEMDFEKTETRRLYMKQKHSALRKLLDQPIRTVGNIKFEDDVATEYVEDVHVKEEGSVKNEDLGPKVVVKSEPVDEIHSEVSGSYSEKTPREKYSEKPPREKYSPENDKNIFRNSIDRSSIKKNEKEFTKITVSEIKKNEKEFTKITVSDSGDGSFIDPNIKIKEEPIDTGYELVNTSANEIDKDKEIIDSRNFENIDTQIIEKGGLKMKIKFNVAQLEHLDLNVVDTYDKMGRLRKRSKSKSPHKHRSKSKSPSKSRSPKYEIKTEPISDDSNDAARRKADQVCVKTEPQNDEGYGTLGSLDHIRIENVTSLSAENNETSGIENVNMGGDDDEGDGALQIDESGTTVLWDEDPYSAEWPDIITNIVKISKFASEPYFCQYCGYQTFEPRTMDVHMAEHAGIGGPYSCHVCDFMRPYEDVTSMVLHIRQHIDTGKLEVNEGTVIDESYEEPQVNNDTIDDVKDDGTGKSDDEIDDISGTPMWDKITKFAFNPYVCQQCGFNIAHYFTYTYTA